MSVVAEVCADLSGHVLVAERPDEQFYAASTMKLPVMIALFRRHEAGELDLDRRVPVVSTFASVHDGSPFRVDADDVDEELLAAEGEERPVRQLIERMITLSSNNATNLVLGLITIAEVQRVADDLGARNTVIARPIGDRAASAAGIQNLVTAADLVAIMSAVATDRAAGPDSCREMLGILARQRHREALPAGIPADVRSASKGGWVDELRHDVAVVWPEVGDPYCQAVCTRGLDDEAALTEIRRRARTAYGTRR
ncbi:MAG TPA: serine hydrolase [Mycobacteriales bacterium]|nr:serine hydrolase [Mycobacteriales bacterium]